MVRAYHLRHRKCQRNAVCVPCRTASKCSLCPTCGGGMRSIPWGVPPKRDDAGWERVRGWLDGSSTYFYRRSGIGYTNILPKQQRMKTYKGFYRAAR